VALTATLEDGSSVPFEVFPFQVRLPNSDAQGGQELEIVLQNVGQELVTELESAAMKPDERIAVVYRVYLESKKDAPQNLPLRLSFTSLTMTDQAVSGTAGRSDVLNQPFPLRTYAPSGEFSFPGLAR
jgi:hypothetical protein